MDLKTTQMERQLQKYERYPILKDRDMWCEGFRSCRAYGHIRDYKDIGKDADLGEKFQEAEQEGSCLGPADLQFLISKFEKNKISAIVHNPKRHKMI